MVACSDYNRVHPHGGKSRSFARAKPMLVRFLMNYVNLVYISGLSLSQ